MRLMMISQILGAAIVAITAYGTEPPAIGGTASSPPVCCNLLLEGPSRVRIAAVR